MTRLSVNDPDGEMVFLVRAMQLAFMARHARSTKGDFTQANIVRRALLDFKDRLVGMGYDVDVFMASKDDTATSPL